MWAVTNQTRFKAERSFVRDRDGAEIWLVAVRATFSVLPDGTVVLAEEQQDVCLVPQFFGEPTASSLRYDGDLVRTKSGTDVVLHAHAHAPYGHPVPFAEVGFSVGGLSKQLRVVGDRVWEFGWSSLVPSEPQRFTSMPICYERACGGAIPNSDSRDPSNPVGVGAAATSGGPVPNIELVGNPIESPRHLGLPAGFGPIPCHWQPRLKLAGTYNEAWQQERQPLVPDDFQDAYFRCAPTDQQCDWFLQGGEEVVLRNLTPEGVLCFRLPRVRLGFRTRVDGSSIHHRGDLHTVIIEPAERRLIMVWHTALPCHHTLYTLKETVVFEKEILNLSIAETGLVSMV